MLDKAISITAHAFVDKFDKGGKPYILHCLHVMHKVGQKCGQDPELMSAAVMHDLIEDTDWTADMLQDKGFSRRVVSTVVTCTHDPHDSYDEYIKKIATSADATLIKREDLRHNSDITRMKGLRAKDFTRIEKYHRAYEYLSD